jgi:hypothetical protein
MGSRYGFNRPRRRAYITELYGRCEDKPGLRLDGLSYQLQWDGVPAVAEAPVAIAGSSSRPGMLSVKYNGRYAASLFPWRRSKARCKGLPISPRPDWSMSRQRREVRMPGTDVWSSGESPRSSPYATRRDWISRPKRTQPQACDCWVPSLRALIDNWRWYGVSRRCCPPTRILRPPRQSVWSQSLPGDLLSSLSSADLVFCRCSPKRIISRPSFFQCGQLSTSWVRLLYKLPKTSLTFH